MNNIIKQRNSKSSICRIKMRLHSLATTVTTISRTLFERIPTKTESLTNSGYYSFNSYKYFLTVAKSAIFTTSASSTLAGEKPPTKPIWRLVSLPAAVSAVSNTTANKIVAVKKCAMLCVRYKRPAVRTTTSECQQR